MKISSLPAFLTDFLSARGTASATMDIPVESLTACVAKLFNQFESLSVLTASKRWREVADIVSKTPHAELDDVRFQGMADTLYKIGDAIAKTPLGEGSVTLGTSTWNSLVTGHGFILQAAQNYSKAAITDGTPVSNHNAVTLSSFSYDVGELVKKINAKKPEPQAAPDGWRALLSFNPLAHGPAKL